MNSPPTVMVEGAVQVAKQLGYDNIKELQYKVIHICKSLSTQVIIHHHFLTEY